MNPHHFKVIDIDEVFRVIRQAETGGHHDPSNALGDQGKSLGPFQISRAFFADAIQQDESLCGLDYEGVRDDHISQVIMLAYWARYAYLPWTAEDLCRLHNGGPSRRGTDEYWDKCKKVLTKWNH